MVFDLSAYLARIGYTGPRDATLDTLAAVHAAHVRTIPFENLDVLLGHGIRIDLESIQQKLVRDGRGGYCFEHNQLLAAALRELAFAVMPLIARVRWQVPAEVATGLTHMLLRVEADGRSFLADVGFGSMSLRRPLVLEFDRKQNVSMEPRRLLQRGGAVVQQARVAEQWEDVYCFSLEKALPIDFEIGNWYTSTHAASRFRQNLVAARLDDDRRLTLLNRDFTIRHSDGRVEKRMIESADELLVVLAENFGLHFAAGTRFGAAGAPWPA